MEYGAYVYCAHKNFNNHKTRVYILLQHNRNVFCMKIMKRNGELNFNTIVQDMDMDGDTKTIYCPSVSLALVSCYRILNKISDSPEHNFNHTEDADASKEPKCATYYRKQEGK